MRNTHLSGEPFKASLRDQLIHDLVSPSLVLDLILRQNWDESLDLQQLRALLEQVRKNIHESLALLRESAEPKPLSKRSNSKSPELSEANLELTRLKNVPESTRTGNDPRTTRHLEAPQGIWIVVDDDPIIHQLWKKHWNHLHSQLQDSSATRTVVSASRPQLLHYHSPEEALAAYPTLLVSSPPDTSISWWVDYRYASKEDQALDGLDLIERLAVADSATLVTSDWKSPEVLIRAKRLGCQTLDKAFLFDAH